MKTVAAQYADHEVHVVVDNVGTHFTPEVRDWLANNPNITYHRTPVGASWINQIKIWFGLITRQVIRRGTFSSVKQAPPRWATRSSTARLSAILARVSMTTPHRVLPAAPGWISIASSSPPCRPFVLATQRALRLDPGCGCRTPKTRRNDQKNGLKTTNPA